VRGVIRRRAKTLHDINVTNLVDVVMAVLIIFILITPLLNNDAIRIQLPETRAAETFQPDQHSITVKINEQGRYYVNGTRVEKEGIAKQVKSLRGARADAPVMIEGDTRVAYGKVVEVMDVLREAGVVDVNLVTQDLPGQTGEDAGR